MRDAGDKAVHEFLVSARDKAETLGNRPRRRSAGSERESRVRSMTEEDFREAEAAAAAMELKLTALGEEEKRAASSEERAASSEERAASSSTASASSSSTSDVAKIPRADDERRRLASEAVSARARRRARLAGEILRGPGPAVRFVNPVDPWLSSRRRRCLG